MKTKTVTVELTLEQIDNLRGVIFEYYSQNEYFDSTEAKIHSQLESILADAEDEAYAA